MFPDRDRAGHRTTGFSRSGRNDTSTRFEAGKQAGPDTIEHFLGGGAEGHAAMANWLRGGFEMDRKGDWRLKPQVADTIQRDVQAVMAQTGWSRAIDRMAQDANSIGTEISGSVSGSASRTGGGSEKQRGSTVSGGSSAGVSFSSTDRGLTQETAAASLDIVNYDVRNAVAAAEAASARSRTPAQAFADTLSQQLLGERGLRNRYLEQADSARATFDITGPLTALEQSSILSSGRLSTDLPNSPGDGDPEFKRR